MMLLMTASLFFFPIPKTILAILFCSFFILSFPSVLYIIYYIIFSTAYLLFLFLFFSDKEEESLFKTYTILE